MQNGLGPTDLVLYCVRPGLRIWQADLAGSVEKTILFKVLFDISKQKLCK